jgi:HSP20 family molecular chaperone IbpA
VLYLSGEKRFERESGDSTYHVTERAYGMFQRSIPLPCRVDPDQADARYRNGVLTVRDPLIAMRTSIGDLRVFNARVRDQWIAPT